MSWKHSFEDDPDSRDLELCQGDDYYNHHVAIVIQCGPTCGIALLTSLIMLKRPREDVVSTANHLLKSAMSMGLSKTGEIMCPQYMSRLCDLAGVQHEVTRLSSDYDVIQLLRDSVLMIIYDKDKNNEPSTKYGGERAHWLMITGFCYRTPEKPPKSRSSSESLEREQSPEAGPPPMPENCFKKASARLSDDTELHVFVQHGKSRHRQLWRWRDVLASNESVRRSKPGNYVVPDNFHLMVADTVVRVPLLR